MASKKLQKKNTLIALTVVAVLAIGGALYVKSTQQPPASQTDQENLKTQEEEAKSNGYNSSTDNEADRRGQSAQTSPVRASSQAPAASQPSNLKPTITSAGHSGNTVYVNAIVDNQTNGTCTLSIAKAGNTTVTRTAPLGLVTSYYACQGFDVERSAFASPGEWTATVSFSNSNGSGVSDPKKINIQ